MPSRISKILRGSNTVFTKPDPRVWAMYDLPFVDVIETYEDAQDALGVSKSPEHTLAILRAYIGPKIEERGALGSPHRALDVLEMQYPELYDTIQVVRRAYGLFRGSSRWGDGPMVATVLTS